MSTEIPWVDAAVKRAGLPPMADLEGALLIYNEVACDSVSVHTFKRYPITYRIVGRYFVDDIIAFVKRRLEEAEPKTPTPRPHGRRKVATAATANPT
jgi:hypothetical protein